MEFSPVRNILQVNRLIGDIIIIGYKRGRPAAVIYVILFLWLSLYLCKIY